MRIDVITIFPSLFQPFLNESLLKKARDKKILEIKIHDLRDYSSDKNRSVDDKPFGGGRGMVMKIEPIFKAVESIRGKGKSQVIVFTPRGRKFNQKKATDWSKLDQLILISGRYEGIDERVMKYIADEKISMGDYVLMGGEVPALAVIEAVSRLIPGVPGKSELLKERIDSQGGFSEYPQYTRPEVFEMKGKKLKTPEVLLSGNHKEIEEWREKNKKIIE